MIKEYNLEPVENILSTIYQLQKRLVYLQLLALLLTLIFFILQALLPQAVFNIYFTAVWLAIEAIVFLLWMRMRNRSHSRLNFRIISFQGKQMGYRKLQQCLILRFYKFIGTLFNFLGIVYAIKSMRYLKTMDWTAIICLLSFALAVHWLTVINLIVALHKKSLAIYDNFQMDLQEEQGKAQEMH